MHIAVYHARVAQQLEAVEGVWLQIDRPGCGYGLFAESDLGKGIHGALRVRCMARSEKRQCKAQALTSHGLQEMLGSELNARESFSARCLSESDSVRSLRIDFSGTKNLLFFFLQLSSRFGTLRRRVDHQANHNLALIE